MQTNPICVSSDTPIIETYKLMEATGVLQLPVLDQGKLVGIITDRDLCIAVHAP
jgi:acetoin utilization protein AcuB